MLSASERIAMDVPKLYDWWIIAVSITVVKDKSILIIASVV
jgi:hypothetical protein